VWFGLPCPLKVALTAPNPTIPLSASAVAAVLIHLGLAEPDLEIRMPGGPLAVRQEPDGPLVQTGPARRVYRARVDPADFE